MDKQVTVNQTLTLNIKIPNKFKYIAIQSNGYVVMFEQKPQIIKSKIFSLDGKPDGYIEQWGHDDEGQFLFGEWEEPRQTDGWKNSLLEIDNKEEVEKMLSDL